MALNLKVPTTTGADELGSIDLKISEAVKKVNIAKHEVARKQSDIKAVEDLIEIASGELAAVEKIASGETPEAQRLRTLENNLDKAILKIQEAVHIGAAYQAIIQKLQKVQTLCIIISLTTSGTIAVRQQDCVD